jgi:cob(I)alamin adenosyltransferase
MRQFSDSIALFPFGCERMRPDEKFRFENVDEDFEQAQMALAKLRELIESGDYFLVVADEILSARATNLITADDVLATMCLFREHSEGREIDFVLTGRSPTTAMIEEADLVSEIQPVKHYWEQGVVAREGIEF